MTRAFRLMSFIAASAVSLGLMLFPFLLHSVPAARLHSALPLMMLGVTGNFVYGIGYTPDHRFVRIILSPVSAWAMMIGGATLMMAR